MDAIASRSPIPPKKISGRSERKSFRSPQDVEPVAACVELGMRATRPRVIGGFLHFDNRHAQLNRMQGQLRLDLETAWKYRRRFDKAAREHVIARQHVDNGVAKYPQHRPTMMVAKAGLPGLRRSDATLLEHTAT